MNRNQRQRNMSDVQINSILKGQQDSALRKIGEKIVNKKRILAEEGVLLFEKGNLA